VGTILTSSGGMPASVAQRSFAQRTLALAAAAFVAVLLVFVAMVAMASPARAAEFAVTKTADTSDGTCNADCSLREAITAANGSPGPDTISFSIPGAGPHTITPATQLPTVTGPVTIDGYTQGDSTPADPADDASPNTLATGTDAVLKIVLNGNGSANVGLNISANDTTVRGLVINNHTNGIGIRVNPGFSGNRVEGNYIGTNAAGSAAQTNGNGVYIDGAPNNTVGGTTPGARNVISGNPLAGVRVDGTASTGNRVEGNYIGTNAAGSATLAVNSRGVYITGAPGNTVGGTTAGARNVISGNFHGVWIIGAASTGNRVEGNYIGTNAAGDAKVANSTGVLIDGAPANVVGGATVGARNVISGNTSYGVHLNIGSTGNRVEGNYIGTDAAGTGNLGNLQFGVLINNAARNTVGGTTGTTPGGSCTGACNIIAFTGTSGSTADGVAVVSSAAATGNRILGNAIFANAHLGIDLANTSVTANDDRDPDTGPNNLQNYPVVQSAKNNELGLPGTTVRGTLNSTPNSTFTVQFFSNPASDPAEGKTYLGEETVATDASGNATFVFTRDLGVANGDTITTTATNTTTDDTSEFSAASVAARVVQETADLTITKADDADPVAFGDDLTYTITVNNSNVAGVPNATGVTVTDTLPANTTFVGFGGNGEGCTYDEPSRTVTCELGAVTAGASATRNIVVSPTAEAAGTTLSNTATVSSPTDPTDASDTETTEVEAAADLSIEKTDDADPVTAGDQLTYTLIISNDGPNAATGVTAVDDLPGTVTYDDAASSPECELTNAQDNVVTCGPVALAPAGEGSTRVFTIVVTPESGSLPSVTNSASVDGEEADPNGDNNTDSETTAVTAEPTLSIDDVTVGEGDSGTNEAVFTVTLSAPRGETVAVDYATANGTATAPGDYATTSGTLVFAPGQTTKTVTVLVNGDAQNENDENYFVELSNATNASISDERGEGVITDDDDRPAPDPDPNPDPNPDKCTITGTQGNDAIRGTAGRDVICGLGGNDDILALGGRDVVRGGPGADAIHGGRGGDSLYGDGGDDALYGDEGRDRLYGGPGNDLEKQ
jgi:CSLREA domain-containing protein/uncharacterized repeat protein (TIGR01451 family)